MQVKVCAVLGITGAGVWFNGVVAGSAFSTDGTHVGRSGASAHNRCIHRDEKIATRACREAVGELYPDRSITLGNDVRSQVMNRIGSDCVKVGVTGGL